MGEINPIGVAVPFFFVLMVAEWAYARRTGKNLYRMNDTIAALTCGMGDQLLGLLTAGITLAAYQGVLERWAVMEWSVSDLSTWAAGMVLVDLFYYAYHRFSHRVNLGWATHVVHHQSEDYNLAVALRQSWFSKAYSWVFYIPLALLGLPAVVWLTCYALNLVYQFWIHTQAIGRLGPLEWVLNTPSHHRVHHGTNPKYIDKNYAGILIVWDRLFGTFQEEDEAVVFGVIKPIRSWNAIVANVMPFVTLAQTSARQPDLLSKVRVWVAPPGWTATNTTAPPPPAADRGYDLNAAPTLAPYFAVHLLPVGLATAGVIALSARAPWEDLFLGATYIAWTGLNWSGLVEGRRWAAPSEWTRLLVVGGMGLALSPAVGWPLTALSVMSLPWLYWGRQKDFIRRSQTSKVEA